jgi:hypothetical protein
MSLRNPLTGRSIKIGGRTYKKLLKKMEAERLVVLVGRRASKYVDQYGGEPRSNLGTGTAQDIDTKRKDKYETLVNESRDALKFQANQPKVKTETEANAVKQQMDYASNLPPAPDQHSWYHHHAPFSQTFGDYVCLKKSTLKELGSFLQDTLSSST